MKTRCVCPSAGFCPLRNRANTVEEWTECQADPGKITDDLFKAGIRLPAYTLTPPKKIKFADVAAAAAQPGCTPCQAAAQRRELDVIQKQQWNPADFGPVLVNSRKRPALGLKDTFAGQRAFLFGGGPSLKSVDLTRLQRPGIVTAAMNNIATVFRPQLWFSVDQPRNFHEAIWRDPGVMKFTFDKYLATNTIQRWDGTNYVNAGRCAECPNVFGFAHVHGWNKDTFLDQPWPTWGVNSKEEDPEGHKNHCSVMLPAIWLLYWLGFRVVYLLGCDFTMSPANAYAFDESGNPSNNDLYGWLNRRFTELKPHFREHGYTVLNCTEGSKLDAFDRIGIDAAIEAALENWPEEIHTRGHYR